MVVGVRAVLLGAVVRIRGRQIGFVVGVLALPLGAVVGVRGDSFDCGRDF